ncbi:unnamed protein product [Rotaria socialis]|uniref:Uncharacterized protein n=1 Tax=Rotaria socialis TaxID=392032 RepID=A0A819YTX9_9BILA|nr:unnamed protein product [Rotaria socialis]CAF3315703.1 unnamed protein product [Rotaria socialis]CAF3429376.1 unnamed protein product [Rotaria socialis]CAF4142372.1 unnamed protein product [Rotaria socialis]CAF4162023.1 unnamed protein product [Rotaria socialis]
MTGECLRLSNLYGPIRAPVIPHIPEIPHLPEVVDPSFHGNNEHSSNHGGDGENEHPGIDEGHPHASHESAESSCKDDDDDCKNNKIAIIITGGVVGLIALIFFTYACKKSRQSQRSKSNVPPVQRATNPAFGLNRSKINIFKSGIWERSRYPQNEIWHGPHQLTLWFDPELTNVVGSGTDDMGIFFAIGTYSSAKHEVTLSKGYLECTDHRLENLNSKITIQLAWNSQNNQFEGK